MLHADTPAGSTATQGPPLCAAASFDVVVVAASLGGRPVLEQLLRPLPADFPASIVIAHHADPTSPGYLAALLARCTRLRVQHVVAGERMRAGTVHVAPPGRHARVTRDGTCELSAGPRVSHACPAADVLFPSAAAAFGPRAVGIVLTGRLYDGAAGALEIRRAGGVVLAQAPATCRAPEMPLAAIRRSAVHFVLPPDVLAAALIGLVTRGAVPAHLDFGRRVESAA